MTDGIKLIKAKTTEKIHFKQRNLPKSSLFLEFYQEKGQSNKNSLQDIFFQSDYNTKKTV